MALLVWKGVPGMIGKMLDQRAAVISAELDEAKRLRAEAAALLADYQKRAAGAEAEAQSIVATATAEAAQFQKDSRAALDYVVDELGIAMEAATQIVDYLASARTVLGLLPTQKPIEEI